MQEKTVKINYNGNIFPANQPLFTVENRAFKYGDGFFETIRIINNEVQLWNLHFERIGNACNSLKMKLPPKFKSSFLYEQILQLTDTMHISENARARLSFFRAEGGRYLPSSKAVEFVIQVEKIDEKGYPLNKKGLVVDLYNEQEITPTTVSAYKAINSLLYVLASVYKKEQNLDECLLINNKVRIAEAIYSNIFALKNNQLITPQLSEGCVAGVMRSKIIEICEKEDIDCQQGTLALEDLFEVDEIFLTNAVKGIQWVGSFKSKNYEAKLSKKLSKILNNNF